MTINEFKEENNHNYENMTFFYIYYTRDVFFSFMHANSCRTRKCITPTKKFYIDDGKCYIICNEGNKRIKYKNFLKRDYPKEMDIIFEYEDQHFKLNTYGHSSKETNTWNYELEEC